MSNEVETWVKRFRVLDAQEEEVVDDSTQYRAMLGHRSEEKGGRPTVQAETKARKPRQLAQT